MTIDWKYDRNNDDMIASYKGMTLRAVREQSPENPFEDWDCNWPIIVRSSDRHSRNDVYDRRKGVSIDEPLLRFSDDLLVHMQHRIAIVLGTTIRQLTEDHDDENRSTNYCRDADLLRDGFNEELSCMTGSNQFAAWCGLYGLLGIPALLSGTNGYCQGDHAQVLVVATPEACVELGATAPTVEQLEDTVALYAAWAWNDVYGYVIEDQDGDQLASSGSFYGSDWIKSGLEGAVIQEADELGERGSQ